MKNYILIALICTLGLGCEISVEGETKKELQSFYHDGFAKGVYCAEQAITNGQPVSDCYTVLEIIKDESN